MGDRGWGVEEEKEKEREKRDFEIEIDFKGTEETRLAECC